MALDDQAALLAARVAAEVKDLRDSKIGSGTITGIEWYATVEDLPAVGTPGVVYFTDVS